jgi:aryl-alcohol dehydrogenase-like predicted oxidoreductase/histidinol phosphatase-like enzyme
MIGLGCMRLSTAADRDDDRSIAVIHAALDSGATLLDTANSYCHDETDVGHNERLIAVALRQWKGDRSSIEVATKGGLRRPHGAWVNEGRAKHLREACDASRRALDVDVIDLYQLHAADPRVPLATSVRALAALQSEGAIRRIGLCNVNVGQIVAAREIAKISAVQVSLSVLDDENLRNGVAEYCREHGIRLIAYRPLGGSQVKRLARDPVLVEIAAQHDATPHEIALAWLLDLSAGLVPIPGATRETTARSLGRARAVRLSDGDRQRLDERFSGRLLRVPRSARRPRDNARGEVVLVMGMPGAGKSGVARDFETHGYERLNRDDRGGSLADLVAQLDTALSAGQERHVLDNTYPSRKSRNEVIECAWQHGVPARCIWLRTSIADAQINAVTRLIGIHGRLPMPEELRERGKADPRYFGPEAQFRYERNLEAPVAEEGFTSIDEFTIVRHPTPNADARALILEYDDVLVMATSGGDPVVRVDDVALAPGRRVMLERYRAEGWLLFASAWRPQIGKGSTTRQDMDDCFARTRELLGLDIDMAVCPHDAGPPVCWCRKPLPGLILDFALRHRVALARSILVGRSPADRTLAQRLIMTYHDASEFFA